MPAGEARTRRPQAGVDGKRWADHDEVIDRIGNLTPLAAQINTSLQDKPFAKKVVEYAKSDLLITKDLAQFNDWNATTIAQRQKTLADLALKAWPYPK